jgi:Domain of unknown function (DUF3291)
MWGERYPFSVGVLLDLTQTQKMAAWHLAQVNIGRIKGVTINDPIMAEFVDNLDRVNQLAEESPGFVWRLKEENNNATSFNPYGDEQVLINMSVWKDVESLEQYVYRTVHTDYLRRRKEWFHAFGKMYMAMWWIPVGHLPTIAEAVEKLDYLQANGASPLVFDFKRRFAAPE